MLGSVNSARAVCRERPWLRFNEAEGNLLFEMLEVEDDNTPGQHDDHLLSPLLTSSRKDDEARPSGAGSSPMSMTDF